MEYFLPIIRHINMYQYDRYYNNAFLDTEVSLSNHSPKARFLSVCKMHNTSLVITTRSYILDVEY